MEKCVTIASACNRFWHKKLVPKNKIASESPQSMPLDPLGTTTFRGHLSKRPFVKSWICPSHFLEGVIFLYAFVCTGVSIYSVMRTTILQNLMTPLLLGDPAKLYAQFRDNALDMTNLHNLSLAELKNLAIDFGISVSQKSKVYISSCKKVDRHNCSITAYFK